MLGYVSISWNPSVIFIFSLAAHSLSNAGYVSISWGLSVTFPLMLQWAKLLFRGPCFLVIAIAVVWHIRKERIGFIFKIKISLSLAGRCFLKGKLSCFFAE
jgi:hypothetical protein